MTAIVDIHGRNDVDLGDDAALRGKLSSHRTLVYSGRVVRAIGTSLQVSGLPVRIGQRCEILDHTTGRRSYADVVGIDRGDAILVPLGDIEGIAVDAEVRVLGDRAELLVGEHLLGHVLDGFAHPLDTALAPAAPSARRMPVTAEAPSPLQRTRISERFATGVRAIDTLLTAGVGQRLGIFAPAGVGKSTLLAMLASHAEADIIVVGLIGERGREVREFVDDALGEAVMARSVVVVATSDRPAMERVNAARTATAIAEGFRAEGRRVLLLLDSVTRYARALREVGLATGEAPVRQGFPPSVFAELPRLFERAGNADTGSITAFYTVLSDQDEALDPIAEEVRSILDGHIVLSRSLAESGHFPAIDVLASLSRLFPSLNDESACSAAAKARGLLAKFRDIEFLVQVGEYSAGSDALADEAIARRDDLNAFLKQASDAHISEQDGRSQLDHALGGMAPANEAAS